MNNFQALVFLVMLSVLPIPVAADPEQPKEGAQGYLLLHGGGRMSKQTQRRFIELAGGKNGRVVIIPTALGGNIDSDTWDVPSWIADHVESVVVLHTNDPEEANKPAFVEPLKQASAVWLSGGRQWRTADAYLDTLVVQEIQALYQRGGIVGGSSAGTTIQGSYLVRGAPEGNHIMMAPSHQRGFGLLPECAVDQHLLARVRINDLIPVIQRHPRLLGIGVDEEAAILVHREQFEVIGKSIVGIYDSRLWEAKSEESPRPYFLVPGERFNLKTRTRG